MKPLVTKRAFVVGGVALTGASALAQTSASALPRIAIQTADGVITVELASDKAPVTAGNFLRYVEARRFDGGAFYRALKLSAAPPAGLIQGGIRNDPAKSFPPIAHESTQTTGLRHLDGTISMARYAPGTATSEFFICVGPVPSLDADPTQSGDNQGFAAFGHVTDGMDVVRAILASPVSPTEGEGALKGQMLAPPVAIVSARRVV